MIADYINYILLILVITLPITYKYLFWLYTIQLKEYRWDRFKEYILTPQGKSAIFNFWFFIELPLLLITITIFFDKNFEIIIYPIIFYFFLIQNIFVIWKIFRKKIIKPKLTGRLILTIFIILFLISLDVYHIFSYNFYQIIYAYIILMWILAPIVIFISIIISSPLVKYLKNKRIKKAVNISQNIKKVTKIWITWSYWKSSIKEFLSSILEKEWNTLKTPKNQNTELSVSSLVINKLTNKYKYFIAEMWAYKIWEIKTLWEIVNHKYWFLTSVWSQHLWLFWNIQNTKTAKLEITQKVLENKWKLYINWENQNIREINFSKKLNIIKYWNEKWSDVTYKINSNSDSNTKFTLKYKNKSYNFDTNIIWEHSILNITWVIAFCLDIWIVEKNIKKYLSNLKQPENTLEITKTKKYTLINDSQNLSENWLLAWLNVLKIFKWNKVLVLDDILELWKKSKEIHINLWEKIAKEKYVNEILFTWANFWSFFKKWLLKGWFDEENFIKNIENIKKWSTILFEWKRSRKYFEALISDSWEE